MMHKLSEIVDLPAKLAAIDQARRTFRESQIRTYGWPDDVSCAGCGDTGQNPDDGTACYCHRGDGMRERAEREASWDVRCPKRYRRFTLESHPNQTAADEVRTWLGSSISTGMNLLLLGPVGTGKTGLAIAALRELHLQGLTVRYGTVPDLLDAMRPRKEGVPHDEVGMHELQRVRVLLMDDIGTEKMSDWAAERLYLVINGRYERELPTIITTNQTMPELRSLVGERAISRLTEDAALVRVGGRDLRREGMR